MKIVIDENVAYADEAFGGFGELVKLHGREITNETLQDADALVVRSITKVDEKLLNGTPVKFVGTATIGTDHIDEEYLTEKEIAFANAKGCNADAVAEYVFTALFRYAVTYRKKIEEMKLGVVGVGNIGRRVVRLAEALGIKVLQNDPPREEAEGKGDFVSLKEIFSCNVVTLHTPLTKTGEHPTYHLFDALDLQNLPDDSLFINACRGEVANNRALEEAIEHQQMSVVLDVWENEPDISVSLLKEVFLGTPHVAGYSLEGKANGTQMIYDALCKVFNLESTWKAELPPVESALLNVDTTKPLVRLLNDLFMRVYDIEVDYERLCKLAKLEAKERGAYFDMLRKEYPLKREFLNYTVKLEPWNDEVAAILKAFRFSLQED